MINYASDLHKLPIPFAKALLMATSPGQLKEPPKKNTEVLSRDKMARMEKETEGLVNDIKLVKESYGKDILNLVLACGYLSRLLDNGKVVRFLSTHYPDILTEFKKIIAVTTLAA